MGKNKKKTKKRTRTRKARKRTTKSKAAAQRGKTSQVKGLIGVFRRKANDGSVKYYSLITEKGSKVYLGSFNTSKQCALEYDKWIREHRGPKAKTNYPLYPEPNAGTSTPSTTSTVVSKKR